MFDVTEEYVYVPSGTFSMERNSKIFVHIPYGSGYSPHPKDIRQLCRNFYDNMYNLAFFNVGTIQT
jgi:hypothetical protein